MTLPLYYQSATELLRRFKDRTLSPVELMQATIDRAGSVEPAVNALSYTFYEGALEKAHRAEQAWQKGGARPLEGLPVAVKDEAAVEGQITSNGSLIWKDNVMPFTEAMVQRLIDAGAIVHARSAAPEFSVNYAVWSKLHGVTHNPWTTDVERHYQNHLCGVGIRTLRSFVPEGSEHLLTDYVRWWFEQSESVTLDDEVAAVAYRVYMTTSIGEVFSKYDALVCPTMSSVRIPVDYDFSHHDHIEINGRKTHCLWGATMTYPFNVLNQCPVLNVPTGLAGNNVPTGMQIVAPGYRDEVAFRVGKAYEAAAGRFIDAANQPAFGSG